MSSGSAASSARTACASVSGRVAVTMSCSASVMSPRPISTRPMRPSMPRSQATKKTTPTKMRSGLSQERSKENTSTMSAVPTSAPSITARPGVVPTSPEPTKLATMRQVAVLLCSSVVTPRPASIALRRLATLRASTLRRFSPKARSTPVRTL